MVKEKQHILLVEDDPFLSDIYSTKLESAGFDLAVAYDGEAVFKKIEEKTPELILLDIVLPKMDGFEVFKKLKADPKFNKIPVILLTNLGQKEDIDKGLGLGARDYLIKANFIPSEIVEKVKSFLKSN
ncbi:MAG: Two component transcriptional regulator, winged helix family [Parcubacteria group bacterium GW2011_GWA2_39_18]|nr:MAG: Two component transcriptional regulator, winged helix family [Parcubacteria group bacterium GW2011_GWA2_39_18]